MADARLRGRAEVRLARPGLIGVQGRVRDAVVALRGEAEAALADADGRLRRAAEDRLAAAERIRACNRALLGTGRSDGSSGEPVLVAVRPSDAFDDPLPDPSALRTIGGAELRAALVDLLDTLGRDASVGELIRLLAAHGGTPAGRASQAVSNALRSEVRGGRVLRVARGVYRAEPASST